MAKKTKPDSAAADTIEAYWGSHPMFFFTSSATGTLNTIRYNAETGGSIPFEIGTYDENSFQKYTAYDVRAGIRDFALTKLTEMGYVCTAYPDPEVPHTFDNPGATITPPKGKSLTDITADMNAVCKAWKDKTAALIVNTVKNPRVLKEIIDEALLTSGLVVQEKNEQDGLVPLLSPSACTQYKSDPERNINDRGADVEALVSLSKLVIKNIKPDEEFEALKSTHQRADKFCADAAAENASDTLLQTLATALTPILKKHTSQSAAL